MELRSHDSGRPSFGYCFWKGLEDPSVAAQASASPAPVPVRCSPQEGGGRRSGLRSNSPRPERRGQRASWTDLTAQRWPLSSWYSRRSHHGRPLPTPEPSLPWDREARLSGIGRDKVTVPLPLRSARTPCFLEVCSRS